MLETPIKWPAYCNIFVNFFYFSILFLICAFLLSRIIFSNVVYYHPILFSIVILLLLLLLLLFPVPMLYLGCDIQMVHGESSPSKSSRSDGESE